MPSFVLRNVSHDGASQVNLNSKDLILPSTALSGNNWGSTCPEIPNKDIRMPDAWDWFFAASSHSTPAVPLHFSDWSGSADRILLRWEQKSSWSGLFSDPDMQKAILNVLTIRHVDASTCYAPQTGERENPPSINFWRSSPFKLWQSPLAGPRSIRTGHKHSDSLCNIQSQPPATCASWNSWAGTGIFMSKCFSQICQHNIV